MQEIVFLGIFDKIANWVMSGISKVLTFLVSNVIVPIFSFLWDNILKYIVELLAEYFGALLYKIYALLLAILYGIERAIYAFAGAVDVKFGKEEGNILSMIFELPGVEEAFWYVNVLGITLCFIFTIYSVTKSTFDFNYDGKKSVGFILTQFFTSAITFLIIPLFCYGLISLTAICTRSLYIATSPAHSVSITDSLFMMTASSNLSAENCAKLQDILNSQPMAWFDWSNVSHVIGKTMNVDYIFGFIG